MSAVPYTQTSPSVESDDALLRRADGPATRMLDDEEKGGGKDGGKGGGKNE